MGLALCCIYATFSSGRILMTERRLPPMGSLPMSGLKSSSSSFPTNGLPEFGFRVFKEWAGFSSAPEKDGDHRLLVDVRKGSEGAFMTTVDRYHPSLSGFAHTLVEDKSQVDAILQETWQIVLESIDQIDEGLTLKTWIFKKLVECVGAWNAHLTSPSFPRDPEIDNSIANQEKSAQPCEGKNPPATFTHSPKDVQNALKRLPPLKQQILYLRDVLGFTVQEVCFLLDVSEPQQLKVLHESRERMRTLLDDIQ